MQAFDIPILFIIFSRPDTTAVVFEEIRKCRPKRLYIFCDGERPHRPQDKQLVAESKQIVEHIDWDCEVFRNYKTENLGCGKGPQAGIDWLFEHEKWGIILEDDCVPSHSFFPFCKEMLERYEHHENIMHISGVNFQEGHVRGEGDYYFSRHQHCWGWATWKRAWSRFDYDMEDYPRFLKENRINHISPIKKIRQYWISMLDEVYYKHSTDIWDYQWSYAIWNSKSLCITPNKNLISNIGFGPNATHTQYVDFLFNIPRFELDFPLRHPRKIKADKAADLYFNIFYTVYKPKTWQDRKQEILKLLNPKQNPFTIWAYHKFIKPYRK